MIGTMTLELGDASTIRCISSDLICEMEFQTKGFFSGECNSVVGKIKKESTQEILYEISGQWSGKLFINKYVAPEKNTIGGILSIRNSNNVPDKKLELLVDTREYSKFPLTVPENQEQKESRRLWAKLTEGIQSNNLDAATEEKSKVEDQERALKKEREKNKVQWKPRFFDLNNDVYTFKGIDKLDYSHPVETCKALDTFFQV